MTPIVIDETSTKLLLAAATAALGWFVRVGSKIDGRVKRLEKKLDGIRTDTQFFLKSSSAFREQETTHFREDTGHYPKPKRADTSHNPPTPPNPML